MEQALTSQYVEEWRPKINGNGAPNTPIHRNQHDNNNYVNNVMLCLPNNWYGRIGIYACDQVRG